MKANLICTVIAQTMVWVYAVVGVAYPDSHPMQRVLCYYTCDADAQAHVRSAQSELATRHLDVPWTFCVRRVPHEERDPLCALYTSFAQAHVSLHL